MSRGVRRETAAEVLEAATRAAHDAWLHYTLYVARGTGRVWELMTSIEQAAFRAAVRLELQCPAGSAKASHERWCAARRAEGWAWGPKLDRARKYHPNLREFEALSLVEQHKDVIFTGVVGLFRKLYLEARGGSQERRIAPR